MNKSLPRAILALFVSAQRQYRGLSIRDLCARLDACHQLINPVTVAQIRAVESGGNVTNLARVVLANWCGLVWDGENWVVGSVGEIPVTPEPIGEAARAPAGPSRDGAAIQQGMAVSENFKGGLK